MAKVKIEDIIYHLDFDMKRALEDAVQEVIPKATFDRDELFSAFLRAVYLKCSTWETVPDQYVEK